MPTDHKRRSKTQIFIHMVWATKRRKPFLEQSDYERRIHRCIHSEAERLNCTVLAVDGMPDHVHLVVQLSAIVSPAKLAQGVKGNSSRFANAQLEFCEPFDWQDNYAAFSVSREELPKVIAYVQNQKQHHADGTLWPELEETDEEDPRW
jgi:putative transposase